ncbi:conserved hypothetical protein [Alkaliphilus metalliredigens QYMF]|uniref:DRTGG domain-containing protein n=1 Tax=Alkaliphilus metalliredigens (strain QYMF) TaxID=293826 RepID=A6TQG4_ALKMQ|nr:DRTGG domain-containing protein [Alkaliphilus metalliredigens]ABR48432.1 conserved hypothetical protein [Alkaliphilus metalliredigens QYMF]
MNLREIQRLLDAEVLTGEEYLDREVKTCFACDLMSDVLSCVDDKTLLLTGLTNPQTIRTAEMIDIAAIVFVRNKNPDQKTVDLAKENELVILRTKHIMYTSSGILYENGLASANIVHK